MASRATSPTDRGATEGGAYSASGGGAVHPTWRYPNPPPAVNWYFKSRGHSRIRDYSTDSTTGWAIPPERLYLSRLSPCVALLPAMLCSPLIGRGRQDVPQSPKNEIRRLTHWHTQAHQPRGCGLWRGQSPFGLLVSNTGAPHSLGESCCAPEPRSACAVAP